MSNIYNCTPYKIDIPDITGSEGIYLFDKKGKKYMDLESGVWCTSVGHNNEQLNDVIKKQISLIMHAGFSYSGTIVEESAESILKITGLENGKCVFLCSGSEAIELARQISKKVTGKKISMTMHDSYLGSYSSVTDRSENWYIFNWEKCKSCKFKRNCRIDCEQFENIPENLSDFIFEPGSSSGFVRFPPESLILNIVKIVKTNGGKIILNEVTTGIGRTGRWFGFNHYGIKADMIAIGKGVGNGYPVSVTVLNKETADQSAKAGFKYMQSHQNDPLGASIVKEVINIIDSNDLVAEAERKGELFLQQLMDLQKNKIITGVRGRGLLFAVDICDKKTGDYIYKKLLEKGFIVCNRGALFRIDPSLIISEEEFDLFIKAFNNILDSI
ncbi:MAG: aminotransferase class III-fold pyridoxal phosphate-dependent enzyme [Candidatus Aminicenantes bacterium]|nr:aminotransferase class III-fold pyridoxal phosphate-dependent enzyme [Candidatus Aminicenantes bacterium]